MKKVKIMTLLLTMSLLAVGCSKSESKKNTAENKNNATSESPSPSASATEDPYTDEQEIKILTADLTGDVTLGEYKGIKASKDKVEVSDEDVNKQIESTLQSQAKNVEIKDRKTIKDGDIVNIDFVGKKDGKAFDGGTGSDYNLTIGSNSFIPGFETGLIGKEVGKKVNLDLTFPKDYSNKDLAGQKVVFEVTINKIQKSEVPTLNDAFVKEVSKTSKTVAEYKKEVKDELVKEKEAEAESNLQTEIWNKVVDNAKVKKYPSDQVKYYGYRAQSNFENQLAYQSMTLDQYLEQVGKSKEDFEKEVESAGKKNTKQKMVFQAIAKKEKIEVSDKEYKEQLKTVLSYYQVDSEKALTEKYGKAVTADIKESLVFQKVLDSLVKSADVSQAK